MRMTLLVGSALTLMMVTGSAAFAQAATTASPSRQDAQQFNRDVGQDRSGMQRDVGGMRSADAHVAYDTRKIRALSIRIAHETGAQKAADMAEKRRYQADEAIYRSQARRLGADNQARLHEYEGDYTARHHPTAPNTPSATPPPL